MLISKRFQNQKTVKRRNLWSEKSQCKDQKFYGGAAQKPDMDLKMYKIEEATNIEKEMQDQAMSNMWHEQQRNRLTTSKYK